jgi:hypothetical protein
VCVCPSLSLLVTFLSYGSAGQATAERAVLFNDNPCSLGDAKAHVQQYTTSICIYLVSIYVLLLYK